MKNKWTTIATIDPQNVIDLFKRSMVFNYKLNSNPQVRNDYINMLVREGILTIPIGDPEVYNGNDYSPEFAMYVWSQFYLPSIGLDLELVQYMYNQVNNK